MAAKKIRDHVAAHILSAVNGLPEKGLSMEVWFIFDCVESCSDI